MNIKLVTKPNWLLVILSGLLFIMVFLPWWTVSTFGYSGSEWGLHNGGILALIMAITGIELSFFEFTNLKYRSYAVIGVGILALLGVLIAFKDLGGGIGMGFGMIIALIISILMIVLGLLDYRGIDVMAKIKSAQTPPPPPSTPPSPPPSSTPPTPPPAPPTPPPAPPAQQ